MFGVIGWIVFGLIVGLIAKLLMPGRDPGGFIITMLLGIAGAVIGGMMGRARMVRAERRRRISHVGARFGDSAGAVQDVVRSQNGVKDDDA